MSLPRISMPHGGTYPPHVVEVVLRVGDPEDGGGEHAWLRITDCRTRPDIVGRMYRYPCRGGAPHWSRLSERAAEAAQRAPHMSDAQ